MIGSLIKSCAGFKGINASLMMTTRTVAGTVKMFSHQKGFGFITTEDNKDVFCHFSAIHVADEGFKTLEPGAKVDVVYEESPRGLSATKVTNVDGSPIVASRPSFDNNRDYNNNNNNNNNRRFNNNYNSNGPRRFNNRDNNEPNDHNDGNP